MSGALGVGLVHAAGPDWVAERDDVAVSHWDLKGGKTSLCGQVSMEYR